MLDSEQDYFSKEQDEFSDYMKELMDGSEGMPVGVQIVSYPCEDELVLEVARKIDQALKANKDLVKKLF